MSELAALTIHELAPLLERRAVSPVEVMQETLARIDALDGRLRAFVTVWPEQALADARAAELAIGRGDYRGPLHGVPLSIKDNIAVAGWPTTNGSALMTDFVTDYDATVVQRLRQAGALIVGKNNLHEWAMGVTCAGGPFGSVCNPWDERRVPGGSSGGSAAAVSGSLVYGAVGTDGKGSIRIPAAWCGIVGLKPTYGLVSRFGQLPPTSSSFDHVGPLAKDVTDVAILLQALAGHDPQDPTSIPSEPTNYRAALARDVRGLRVGVPDGFFFEQTAPEVTALVRQALDVLKDLGAQVAEVTIPTLEYMPLVDAVLSTEIPAFLLPYVRQGPRGFADRTIWERIVVGQLVRTADTFMAARLRNLIRREFRDVMETVDVLAMPTTPGVAFPRDTPEQVAAMPSLGHQSPVTVLTVPHDIVGMPAVSVPCGFTPEGMPVGLMLGGRHWADDVVLRAAYAYEQAATGGYRVPPVAGLPAEQRSADR
jgi:aspartyl-tRNA(Asn)/glutamyl-tRNA(Gln) amidotransferase subunit A